MKYTRLGLIGAMEEEIEWFHSGMKEVETEEIAGIRFAVGQFGGVPVVVCKSGVGKVNAAVCTQILIDRFGVDAILFTGVAGALDPKLNIGDIVVSTDCMHHDMDVTALGFERGVVPYQNNSIYRADEMLHKLAYDCSCELFPNRTVGGRILSGDQFIADRKIVNELYESMNGACTEMEGAAVAQVCEMHGIPFVIIRSMSDKADGSADINFVEFTRLAAENSFRIVEKLLSKLVEQQ
ncbi:5'-methylthioadenosine/adenosylhomocysteine nucleosidase [Paenibacillus sp. J2TS4]|uniref:5'-methylthioadenosine/adenosylhomocysteine nucleosidase n=1 Tax=Paenibacillus sp. J2TS4 TaxID=2807194 RepID=UPI001B028982|nr:5'-methylthioadenosine/adenosylhomocysteine nucleosidase [Paenibacillus sp. J2TS4]GIP32898.1 5'-methylthioadenosine/S-adenosylhomocysteine nucleosidase [Paenibacillus sp. J2TS4]